MAACMHCNREITNPNSLARGFGPVCWQDRVDFILSQGEAPLFTMLHDQLTNPDVILERDGDIPCTNIEHREVKHSPSGFEWGYGGSGPADLAYNILLKYGCTKEEADLWHQDFKFYHVSTVPHKGGVIEKLTIEEFIQQKKEAQNARKKA